MSQNTKPTTGPALHDLLADPFPANVIGWKAQSVKDNRALAVAYIEARDVMNRLDRVVGPENWWASFSPSGEGIIVCRLTIRLPDGREVTKEDVGGESDQPDQGDKVKAAYSDALKRAAVHWGIGRYLYYLPRTWCDYNTKSRQIDNPPSLPDWAVPKFKDARRYALMAFVGVAPEDEDDAAAVGPQRQPRAAAQPAKPAAPKANGGALPTGPEFESRMFAKDAQLAAEGLCQPGALVKGVMAAGNAAGHTGPFASWNRAGVELAAKVTRDQEVAWRAGQEQGDASEDGEGGATPNVAPPSPAADPRDDLIRAIDARLRGANRSWQGALLAEVGAGQLSGFLEPENVGQALGVVKVHASLEQLQRIAAGLEPKAAAKAPAKRKTA